MSFEDLKARIAVLLEESTHQPEDLHETLQMLREQIAEMRALNQSVPEDLLAFERQLKDRFSIGDVS